MKKRLLLFTLLTALIANFLHAQCSGYSASITYDTITYNAVTSCEGDLINLNAGIFGGSAPYSYYWSSTANNTTYPDNSVISEILTSGESVALQITDVNGCVAGDTIVLQEGSACNSNLCSGFYADAYWGDTACAAPNSQIQLGGSPTAVGGTPSYNYQWYGPGLNSNAIANPVATLDANNQYSYYSVVVTDSNGCVDGDTLVVIQDVNCANCQSLTADASIIDTVCAGSGGVVQVGGNPTAFGGFGNYQYEWINWAGNGAIFVFDTTANPTVTYDPVETVNFITVQVTDGVGCTDSDTVWVVQDPSCDNSGNPCDSVSINTNHLLDSGQIVLNYGVFLGSSQSLFYASYGVSAVINGNTTQFAQGSFTGDTSITISLDPSNTYNAYVEVAYFLDSMNVDTCLTRLSETIDENILSNVVSIALESQVNLFPNPTSDVTFMEVDNALIGSRVEVLNAVGQTVKSFVMNESREEITTSNFAEGFYSVVIRTTENRILVKKLMVVK